MLNCYVVQGTADALNEFGFHKLAMELGSAGRVPTNAIRAIKDRKNPGQYRVVQNPKAKVQSPTGGGRSGIPTGPATQAAEAHAAAAQAAGADSSGSGLWDTIKNFGRGQWGAAKSLASNLHQGLGGADTPAAGAAARADAMGNLKTLAPSLLAGGGLYMLHRHNQEEREREAQQRALMQQRGY